MKSRPVLTKALTAGLVLALVPPVVIVSLRRLQRSRPRS